MGSSSRPATLTHLPLLLLLPLLIPFPPACAVVTNSIRSTTFSFNRFDQSIRDLAKIITFTANSSAVQGALQITPLAMDERFMMNQTGAIFYASPFVMSKSTPDGRKEIASFSTTFAISLQRINASIKGGEGLAFLIASSDGGPPPGSYGGFLGLSNGSTDGNSSNGFAAIEFDTVQQEHDIDDNHVGLDVNGVQSVCATSLAPMGIVLSDGSHTVRIDYDGSSRTIYVYMSNDLESKPAATVLQSPIDLSRIILGREAFFGFSASTGLRYEGNYVRSWNMTVQLLDDHPKKTSRSTLKLAAEIGLPCIAVLLVIAILGGAVIYTKRTSKLKGTIDFRTIPGVLREYTYRELKDGSNNFEDAAKLGQGSFGVVFRAKVQTTEVAVKRFSGASTKGRNDFLAELRVINGLRHRHLVKLLGWCQHGDELLLVYELMPKGSLDKFILGHDGHVLSWDQRYNVVVGLASAINYLHYEYGPVVIHRDIKPSNIMLDSAMDVHLGDFGLARALDRSGADAISAGGTRGYMAPECLTTNKATKGSDVYSFGTVIMEVVCGRLIVDVLENLWTLYGAGSGRIVEAVDPTLAGQFDRGDAERILLLGLACTHPNPGERPGMQRVVRVLARSDPPPAIAPSNVWPARLASHSQQQASSGNALTGSISSGSPIITSNTVTA